MDEDTGPSGSPERPPGKSLSPSLITVCFLGKALLQAQVLNLSRPGRGSNREADTHPYLFLVPLRFHLDPEKWLSKECRCRSTWGSLLLSFQKQRNDDICIALYTLESLFISITAFVSGQVRRVLSPLSRQGSRPPRPSGGLAEGSSRAPGSHTLLPNPVSSPEPPPRIWGVCILQGAPK